MLTKLVIQGAEAKYGITFKNVFFFSLISSIFEKKKKKKKKSTHKINLNFHD